MKQKLLLLLIFLLLFKPAVPAQEHVKYISYEELTSELLRMNKSLNIFLLRSLGKTHLGREIWCCIITEELNSEKEAFLLIAAHHGDEAVTTGCALYFIKYLIHSYYSGNSFVKLLLKRKIVIVVPMLNPDGYELKTRKNGRVIDLNGDWNLNCDLNGNGVPDGNYDGLLDSNHDGNPYWDPEPNITINELVGVDINRNYPFHWAESIDDDGDGLIDEDSYGGGDQDGDWTLEDDINHNGVPDSNLDGTPYRDDDGDGLIDEEQPNLLDDDGDGLIDEDCVPPADYNGDGNPKLDPEPHVDEDPPQSFSKNPRSLVYCGPSLLSEPESRAIQKIIEEFNVKYCLTLHSGVEMLLYPYGYAVKPELKDYDLNLWNSYLTIIEEIRNKTCYPCMKSSSLYPAAGELCDWLAHDYKIVAMTLEVYWNPRTLSNWERKNPPPKLASQTYVRSLAVTLIFLEKLLGVKHPVVYPVGYLSERLDRGFV